MPANALFRRFCQGLMNKEIDLDSDDIRAILVDAEDVAKLITGATNATPIVVTSNSHGYSNGQIVSISAVGGNTAANGVWKTANVTTNTFELVDRVTGANSSGNGSYTSGGYAVNMTVLDFLDDIPSGARVKVSGTLGSPTIAGGRFDTADFTFSGVTGDPSEMIVLYQHTGTESTSLLIALYADGMTGMPVTPNGGDINVTVHANGWFDL